MTVDGPIDPSTLGVTLVHEHLHMDARPLLARVHGYEVSGTAGHHERDGGGGALEPRGELRTSVDCWWTTRATYWRWIRPGPPPI